MTSHQFPPKKRPNLEILVQRQQLFLLILKSHLKWMNETSDPDIQEKHRVLATLFTSAREQYKTLIDALRSEH